MASNTGGRPISSKYLRPTSRPPEVSPTGSDASLEVSAPTQRGGSGKLIGRGGERGQLNRWMKLYIKKSSVSTRHVSSTLIPSLLPFPLSPFLNVPLSPSLLFVSSFPLLPPSPFFIQLPLSLSPSLLHLLLALIFLSVPSDSSSLPEEAPLLITSTTKHSPRPSKPALQEEDHEVG